MQHLVAGPSVWTIARYGDNVLESPTGHTPWGVLSGLNSRTAVYVIRTYGGQGGASPRGEPLSQWEHEDNDDNPDHIR